MATSPKYAFTDEKLSRMLTFIDMAAGQKLTTTVLYLDLPAGLSADSNEPNYKPMSEHIDENSAFLTTGITKAFAFQFHKLSDKHIDVIMPQGIKSYDGEPFDPIRFKTNIKSNANRTNKSMFDRLLSIAFDLLKSKLQDQEWIEGIAGMTDQELEHEFSGMLDKYHMHYVYAEGWKAVSFQFVWNDGQRSDPELERVRTELRLWTHIGTAIIIREVLVHILMEVNREVNVEGVSRKLERKVRQLTPDVVSSIFKGGKKSVRDAWDRLMAHEAFEGFEFDAGKLPAEKALDSRKLLQKGCLDREVDYEYY